MLGIISALARTQLGHSRESTRLKRLNHEGGVLWRATPSTTEELAERPGLIRVVVSLPPHVDKAVAEPE